MEKEQLKRSILATLLKLSTADQKVSDKEFTFIKDIARRIGITDNELGIIIGEYDQLSLKIPQEEKDRMTILYYLLFLMKIDGDADEDEQLLVKQLGVRLGFRDQMVDSMVDIIKEFENSTVPQESLLESIKKYLN